MLIWSLISFTISLQLNFNNSYYYIYQEDSSSLFGTDMKYCSNQQVLFVSDPDYQKNGGKGAVFVYLWDIFNSKFKLFQIIHPNGIESKKSFNFGQSITFMSNCETVFISSYNGIEIFQKTHSGLYQFYNMISNEENLGKTVVFDEQSGSLIASDEHSIYQIKIDFTNYIQWRKIFTCPTSVLYTQYVPDRTYYTQCDLDPENRVYIFEFNQTNHLNLQDYETKGELFRVCQSNNNLSVIYQDNYAHLLEKNNRKWSEYAKIRIGFHPAKLYYPYDTLFEAKDDRCTYNFYQLYGNSVGKTKSIALCENNGRIVYTYFLDSESLLAACEGNHKIMALEVLLTPTSKAMKNAFYWVNLTLFIVIFIIYFYLYFSTFVLTCTKAWRKKSTS